MTYSEASEAIILQARECAKVPTVGPVTCVKRINGISQVLITDAKVESKSYASAAERLLCTWRQPPMLTLALGWQCNSVVSVKKEV